MTSVASGESLLDGLAALSVRLVTGVPCSYFAAPLRLLQAGATDLRYVAAVNEGSALAVAAGASLGGDRTAVMVQNSGFGNLINPLTSLVLPYRIPVLVLMSMRGWPRAGAGEQQHHWMGRVAQDWLRSLEIPHWMVGPGQAALDDVLPEAQAALAERLTPFILVAKGAIADPPGGPGPDPARAQIWVTTQDQTRQQAQPTRSEMIAALLAEVTDERILATTGCLSRELFNQGDRATHFYMQGSMGHVASIALGAALARPEHRFVVLDGDGAMLMHAGTLATVGHFRPRNLSHIVFDNGAYESTGAQPTAAGGTDFEALARACGYRETRTVDSVAGLPDAVQWALRSTQASLLVVRGRLDAAPGGRASEAFAPDEIAVRFAGTMAGALR